MNRRERRRFLRQLLESMTPGARWLLVAVVFLCFAPFGLLSDLGSLGPSPWYRVAAFTLWSGGLAVALGAASATGRPRMILLAGVVIFLGIYIVRRGVPEAPPTALGPDEVAALRHHVTVLATLTIADVALMYVSFVMLIQGEGQRFMRAHTEIRLAREIHRALVPPLIGSSVNLAWRGVSHPSGEVGGDLVDVIVQADGWLG
jgi:hypothetical protein